MAFREVSVCSILASKVWSLQDSQAGSVSSPSAGFFETRLAFARSGKQTVKAATGLVEDRDCLACLLGRTCLAYLSHRGEKEHARLAKPGCFWADIGCHLLPRRWCIVTVRDLLRTSSREGEAALAALLTRSYVSLVFQE